MKTWEESRREDLSSIPFMKEHGWTPEFHQMDVFANYITPDNPPSNGVNFYKGNTWIWDIFNGWQIADKIEGKFCNHRPTKAPLREIVRMEGLKVVIEVLGGVASVKECPLGIQVEIVDYDNIPEE
jgi:hypothetical protein